MNRMTSPSALAAVLLGLFSSACSAGNAPVTGADAAPQLGEPVHASRAASVKDCRGEFLCSGSEGKELLSELQRRDGACWAGAVRLGEHGLTNQPPLRWEEQSDGFDFCRLGDCFMNCRPRPASDVGTPLTHRCVDDGRACEATRDYYVCWDMEGCTKSGLVYDGTFRCTGETTPCSSYESEYDCAVQPFCRWK